MYQSKYILHIGLSVAYVQFFIIQRVQHYFTGSALCD